MAVLATNTITTPIILNSGTLTASSPIFNLGQTWNNGAATFTGIKFNVTDTASAAGSLLMDFQVGGVSKFNVGKDGTVVSPLAFVSGGNVRILNNAGYYALGTSNDVVLTRDAANILALRNGTAAQAFNVYNTYTDASNYERGYARWNAGVYEFGMEALGTGAAKHIRINRTSGANLYLGEWQVSTNGHFLANADNTYDIGASGANRPRTIYAGTSIIGPTIIAAAGGAVSWTSRLILTSPADSVLRLSNNATTITTDITLTGASAVGGSTATFGGSVAVDSAARFAWGGKGYITQGTDGAFSFLNSSASNSVTMTVGASNLLTLNGGITAGGTITAGASSRIGWAGVSQIYGGATNGNIVLSNAAATDFGLLQFGGTTSAFPAIKRSGNSLQVRLADDSNLTDLSLNSLIASGIVRTQAKTVATLPSAATALSGARSLVTDANATMAAGIGTAVVGGGANIVPVYSDGTNWIIG